MEWFFSLFYILAEKHIIVVIYELVELCLCDVLGVLVILEESAEDVVVSERP